MVAFMSQKGGKGGGGGDFGRVDCLKPGYDHRPVSSVGENTGLTCGRSRVQIPAGPTLRDFQ